MNKNEKKQNYQKDRPEPFFAKGQDSKKLVIQTDLRAGRKQYERGNKF